MLTNNAYSHFPTKGKPTKLAHLLEITAHSGVLLKWMRMENMFPENGVAVDQDALRVMINDY